MAQRKKTVTRETTETVVSVTVDLDGTGSYNIDTGNGVLDHLLAQLSRHSLIDLSVAARGDTKTGWHHTVEDVAITLGEALHKAVGGGKGIRRMGHALVPLDESLAQVAVDMGGRGYAVIDLGLTDASIGDLAGDLVRHFLETLAIEGRFTMHARVLDGVSPHHKAEATFKALARALRDSLVLDTRVGNTVPSTKGRIRT